jgi:hypothetical protein
VRGDDGRLLHALEHRNPDEDKSTSNKAAASLPDMFNSLSLVADGSTEVQKMSSSTSSEESETSITLAMSALSITKESKPEESKSNLPVTEGPAVPSSSQRGVEVELSEDLNGTQTLSSKASQLESSSNPNVSVNTPVVSVPPHTAIKSTLSSLKGSTSK